jgi:RNA polymerase sigma factor (sigma-70 family)
MTRRDSLTELDAWLWGGAPPASPSSTLMSPSGQIEVEPTTWPAVDGQDATKLRESPPDLGWYLPEQTESPPLGKPEVTETSRSGVLDVPREANEAILYDIAEVNEDFQYELEIDTVLEAQLEQIRQQDYGQRVEILLEQFADRFDYQDGLTYGDLVTALKVLDRDPMALIQLRDELKRANIYVVRQLHRGRLTWGREVTLADLQLLNNLFGSLIEIEIDPNAALQRLGYANVLLSSAECAMLFDALKRHQLSRTQEQELFMAIWNDQPCPRVLEECTSAENPVHDSNSNCQAWIRPGADPTYMIDDVACDLENADNVETSEIRSSRSSDGPAPYDRALDVSNENVRLVVHMLVEDNLWLVARIARQYIDRGLPLEDLFQEGVLGLYRAIQRFDVNSGNRFMTYASSWIHQSIGRAVSEKARLIRLPVHINEAVSRANKATEQLQQQLLREPTTQEVARELKMPSEKVLKLIAASQPIVSLDELMQEGESNYIERFVTDEQASDAAKEALQYVLEELIGGTLGKLDQREEQLLRLRYGFIDGCPRTLEEVAKEFGVTRERVRQLETRLFRKLEAARYGLGNLTAFLDDGPGSESDNRRERLRKAKERELQEKERRRAANEERLKSLERMSISTLTHDLQTLIAEETKRIDDSLASSSYLSKLDVARKMLKQVAKSLRKADRLDELQRLHQDVRGKLHEMRKARDAILRKVEVVETFVEREPRELVRDES